MADAKKLVEEKINGKRVVVFSKSTCPFCTSAKAVFQKYISTRELKEEDYEVIEIDNRSDCSDIQDELRRLTGARSVPRVFIDGKCIGGGDDTSAAHKNGKLKALLAA